MLSINCCDNVAHSSVVLRPDAAVPCLDDWTCDRKVADILHAGMYECMGVEMFATVFHALFSIGSPSAPSQIE